MTTSAARKKGCFNSQHFNQKIWRVCGRRISLNHFDLLQFIELSHSMSINFLENSISQATIPSERTKEDRKSTVGTQIEWKCPFVISCRVKTINFFHFFFEHFLLLFSFLGHNSCHIQKKCVCVTSPNVRGLDEKITGNERKKLIRRWFRSYRTEHKVEME